MNRIKIKWVAMFLCMALMVGSIGYIFTSKGISADTTTTVSNAIFSTDTVFGYLDEDGKFVSLPSAGLDNEINFDEAEDEYPSIKAVINRKIIPYTEDENNNDPYKFKVETKVTFSSVKPGEVGSYAEIHGFTLNEQLSDGFRYVVGGVGNDQLVYNFASNRDENPGGTTSSEESSSEVATSSEESSSEASSSEVSSEESSSEESSSEVSSEESSSEESSSEVSSEESSSETSSSEALSSEEAAVWTTDADVTNSGAGKTDDKLEFSVTSGLSPTLENPTLQELEERVPYMIWEDNDLVFDLSYYVTAEHIDNFYDFEAEVNPTFDLTENGASKFSFTANSGNGNTELTDVLAETDSKELVSIEKNSNAEGKTVDATKDEARVVTYTVTLTNNTEEDITEYAFADTLLKTMITEYGGAALTLKVYEEGRTVPKNTEDLSFAPVIAGGNTTYGQFAINSAGDLEVTLDNSNQAIPAGGKAEFVYMLQLPATYLSAADLNGINSKDENEETVWINNMAYVKIIETDNTDIKGEVIGASYILEASYEEETSIIPAPSSSEAPSSTASVASLASISAGDSSSDPVIPNSPKTGDTDNTVQNAIAYTVALFSFVTFACIAYSLVVEKKIREAANRKRKMPAKK
ncbi:MAG: hypothetical protein LBL82_00775 [Oscillospiraceae bacterium]|jgi:hypothetical protein|nr:hypothetical protein [Oscillospiraceae bacterium]